MTPSPSTSSPWPAPAPRPPRGSPLPGSATSCSRCDPETSSSTELIAFLKNPVKEFVRKRLDVTFIDEGEETLDGIPVELDGLEAWKVGDRLLRDLLAGRAPRVALDKEWRRGVLPPGKLGWRLAKDLLDQAQPVADLADTLRAGRQAEALDVAVDLGGGRLLTGTVTDVYGEPAGAHQLLPGRTQALDRRLGAAAGPLRQPAHPPLLRRIRGARGQGTPWRSGRPDGSRGLGPRRRRPRRSCSTWSRSTTPGCASRCRCRSSPVTSGP